MLIHDQRQTQKQKIDPKIILANTLLQLSGVEVEQAIEQELLENPALEQEDEDPCADCQLAPFACGDCRFSPQPDFHILSVDGIADCTFDFTADPDEEDPMSRIHAEVSLHEHLRNQLRDAVSGRLEEIADYLVNYIGDDGYLQCDLMELPLELDATDEELAAALAVIQTLDPPGVGAKDLHECLLIQLRALAEDGGGNRSAERIVSECWDEFPHCKETRVARRLKLPVEAVRKALEFIRTRLNPYPAAGFRPPWENNPSENRDAVRPDIVIRRVPTGYEVEIVADRRTSIAVSTTYRETYRRIREMKDSSEESKHVVEMVERADLFIRNLNQRRKTLRNITKCVVEQQQGFLATGSNAFLRSLTRVAVAEMLGIHESTVSRATANKYAQLPSQEVVPFDFFFQTSMTLKDLVLQLVKNEERPLSDQQITDILTEQGHTISRRTVAKYRAAAKVLSSHHRKK
ncbi:MAG: RNA polymerase factor sigma-54 [Armatimonadota bacterium]